MIVLKSYVSSIGPQKMIEKQNFDFNIVDAHDFDDCEINTNLH